MTYKDALKQFKLDTNHCKEFGINYKTWMSDKPARVQQWCDYIDSLHRDRIITDKQVQNWGNPFYK